MRNIMITGVSGYLGTRLVQELGRHEDVGSIIGVDIVAPRRQYPKLDFHALDIRDRGLGKLLSDKHIELVYHLAFVVSPIHDLDRMHSVDFHGTRNVLESCLTAGVRHVIVTSSTLAYGAHPDNPPVLNENHPLRGNARFPYGHNKAIVDEMMQIFAQGHPDLKLTILRPCTVFGPTVDNYVSRSLFLPITARVMGFDPPVQFIHEDDFVDACLKADRHSPGGAFNIAGDGVLKTTEIVRIIGNKALPLPAFIIYPLYEMLWQLHVPLAEANCGYLDYVCYPFIASNAKAKSVLGFAPRFDARQTLEATAASKKKRHG